MGVYDLPLTVARERVAYDPLTGLFKWKVDRWRNVKSGTLGGCYRKSDGYFSIAFRDYNARVLSHRLAWFLMTGSWPIEEIDHINGDRADNRWLNLRAVSKSQNMQNTCKKPSTSKKIGVYWDRRRSSWVAAITLNPKKIQILQTTDFFEACCARKSAEIYFQFHENHGLLSRHGFHND